MPLKKDRNPLKGISKRGIFRKLSSNFFGALVDIQVESQI